MSVDSRIKKKTAIFGNWIIDGESIGDGSGRKNFVYKLKRGSAGWEEYSALKVIPLTEEFGSWDQLSLEQQNNYGEILFQKTQKAKEEIITMEKLRGNTHIVDYLDFDFVDWSGEDSFGRDMYIRMELLSNLRTELKHNRTFSEREIIKIGCDVCKALSLCHSKGIIHRDIKPDNIFVNKDGNYKLGDFGISKSLPDLSNGYAGTGIGTFAYMPAEQLKGKYNKTVDIYSLGLVLYELSNGNKLPFALNTYATDQEVIQRLSGKKFAKPSNASAKLAEVILKACAFNPKDRYASAEEFLSALESVLITDGSGNGPVKKIVVAICVALFLMLMFVIAIQSFTRTPDDQRLNQYPISDILEREWDTGRYYINVDEDQHLTMKITDEFLTNYNTRADGVEGISVRLYHDTKNESYYNVGFILQAGKLYGSVSYYAQGTRTSRFDPVNFSYTEDAGTIIADIRGNDDLTDTMFDIEDIQIVYLRPHDTDLGPIVIFSTFEPLKNTFEETEPEVKKAEAIQEETIGYAPPFTYMEEIGAQRVIVDQWSDGGIRLNIYDENQIGVDLLSDFFTDSEPQSQRKSMIIQLYHSLNKNDCYNISFECYEGKINASAIYFVNGSASYSFTSENFQWTKDSDEIHFYLESTDVIPWNMFELEDVHVVYCTSNEASEVVLTHTIPSSCTRVQFNHFEGPDDANGGVVTEKAIIMGVNIAGETMWIHETDVKFEIYQSSRIESIGYINDKYYYTDDDTVVILDARTGKVVSRVENLGYSITDGYVDYDSTLYFCCYEGPHFVELSSKGKVTHRIEDFGNMCDWAYDVYREGNCIYVACEIGPNPYRAEDYIFEISLKDYSFTLTNPDDQVE